MRSHLGIELDLTYCNNSCSLMCCYVFSLVILAIYAIPVIRICILVLSSCDQPFSMGYHGLFLKLPACESLQYCCQLTLYDCENIIPYLMNNGIYAQFNPPCPGPHHHHHRIE